MCNYSPKVLDKPFHTNLLKEEKIMLVIFCNLVFLLVFGYITYRTAWDVGYQYGTDARYEKIVSYYKTGR